MNTRRFSVLAVVLLASGAGARADFTFGKAVNVGPAVNSADQDATPHISADGLSLFFSSNRPGGAGSADLWVSTRRTVADPWGKPVNLGAPVNTTAAEGRPCLSADGLTLLFTDFTWFSSVRRPGGKGGSDLWMTTRPTRTAPWDEPINLSELNSPNRDEDPSLTADGLTLFFISNRSGSSGTDIWMAARATTADRWGTPVRLGPNVNTSWGECGPCISPDGLTLFFDSTRASGGTCLDIFFSKRNTLGEPFGPAVKVSGIGTCSGRSSLSSDGRTLYYESLWDQSLGSGLEDLWQMPISPVLDFNGDGDVDAKDLGLLVANWGRSELGCDIGPCPWGDGLVDAQDLAVLMDFVARPASHATDVSRDIVLTWRWPAGAATHDVYFGTSWEDVKNADRTNPRGVLLSQGQAATTYDPAGLLEFHQTYYWRIDTVAGPADSTTYRGPVLNFRTEALAYPIKNVTAAASSAQANAGPERTVDGSGLDENDGHSTNAQDMWMSLGKQPNWIQYTFDQVYTLHELWVWNSNQLVEPFIGFGAKTVRIEYSTDGAKWTPLANVPEFAKAPGREGYTHNIVVTFGGVAARYVRLTAQSNWNGVAQQTGLSEVRFFCVPMAARRPDPSDGATQVHPQVTLSWQAGRAAGTHEVYVGTDRETVADGTAPRTTVAQARYEAPVKLDQTYYWKVVEINQVQTPGDWPSDVWRFSTLPYITIDDFENYTDQSPKAVFQTWIDGGGFTVDTFFPNGNTGNGTGSQVGYSLPGGSIVETVSAYGGRQSMPLSYDNRNAPRLSEAVRTFDPPQDLTKHGITTLTLFFRGDVNNTGAPVYARINAAKVIYNQGVAATTTPLWKQWNIDLASSGADLQSIKTLALGVGDGIAGGTGTILIDEIRLYATPVPVPVPTDPGSQGLAVFYDMEGNVQDRAGRNLHGTARGNPNYAPGPAGHGKSLTFDGGDDYVELPLGSLISTLSDATIAVWVNFRPTGGVWPIVFGFTTGTTSGLYLTPQSGTGGPVRFAIATAAVSEQGLDSQNTLPSGWHHVAVVMDSAALQIRLYIDGVPVASGPTKLLPKDVGVTTENWVGRSVWGDPYFCGSLDDLRIYSRSLSQGEILYLAGGR